MNLSMSASHAAAYKSGSQRAGKVTEAWGAENFYCANCSSPRLTWLKPGTAANDYQCPSCGFWYQLKSKKSPIGKSIRDGAYKAMMDALKENRAPSFFFLHYEIISSPSPLRSGGEGRGEEVFINSPLPDPLPAQSRGEGNELNVLPVSRGESEGLSRGEGMIWLVRNLILVPHFAFPPSAIIKCPPLALTARRAGWVGCNFALNRIPADARIPVIVEKQITPPSEVREKFQKVKPFEDIPVEKRGWMLDVLNVVQKLGKKEFTNQDVYAFEQHFRELHPDNHFIRDKIRQQLQNLARAGLLLHAGRNDYRVK